MKFLCTFVILMTLCVGCYQEILTPDDYIRIQSEDHIKLDILPEKPAGSMGAEFAMQDSFFNKQSPYAKAIEAIFSIGARLQILIAKSDAAKKNFLVSPLSMAVAVGELMLGARGKLRSYLADLLVIDNDSLNLNVTENEIPLLNIHQQIGNLLHDLQHSGQSQYVLKTAGALFLQPGLELNPLFEQSITEIYDTKIVQANFSTDPIGSFKLVNDWAVKNTGGRIKEILSAPLPATVAAILANAVYFKAEWETPFSDELTAPGDFHLSPNETVQTTFLRGQFDASWAESDDLNCSILILPYKRRKVSMYLFLPKVDRGSEYNLTEFTQKLRSKDIFHLIKLTRVRSVRVMLPKINLSNTISLLDPLKQYEEYKEEIESLPKITSKFANKGNETDKLDLLDEKIDTYKEITADDNNTKPISIDVGNSTADPIDLSGASKDARFKLSDIVQQISLAINEKGTEAAAISSSTISLSGGVKNFYVNRPFFFFIRHENTEAILFWGSVVSPT